MTTLEELRRLPVRERMEIAAELWDSVAADMTSLDLPPELRAELDARLDDFQRNPRAGRPWAEVRAEIERAL